MMLLSYFIILVVLGAGVVACLGWREWAVSRRQAGEPHWRNTLTLAALILLSAATLLFFGYAGHSAAVRGDRNGNAITLLCIRSGNYL
jgi:hypothetical protein